MRTWPDYVPYAELKILNHRIQTSHEEQHAYSKTQSETEVEEETEEQDNGEIRPLTSLQCARAQSRHFWAIN